MNTFETLAFAQNGAVATLTLNRPDVRNAFNETMIAELDAVFCALDARDDIRAVVLAANGKAFCAGADLTAAVGGRADGSLTAPRARRMPLS